MTIDLEKIKQQKSVKELLEFAILNIDKPSGPTSFTVSNHVKTLLGLRKSSHGGTLDPQVSGVLPVMLNRACRLSEYIMHRNKTYVGIMRLHALVPDAELHATIKEFLGKITQLPPKRSRVKRALREREVMSFEIKEREGNDLLFETQVQAGTYIRKICHDMGESLGVGAHMLELRRTEAGVFHEPAVTLYELNAAWRTYAAGDEGQLRALLIPGEVIGTVLPIILVSPESVKKLYTGSPLFTNFIQEETTLSKDTKVAVFEKETFIGCYHIVNEGTVRAVPEFVLN